MIEIELNDSPVLDALNELMRRASDPEPALRYIGEKLVDSTKQRFVDGRAPEGDEWAKNEELTLAFYLSEYKGNFKKDGSIRGCLQKESVANNSAPDEGFPAPPWRRHGRGCGDRVKGPWRAL